MSGPLLLNPAPGDEEDRRFTESTISSLREKLRVAQEESQELRDRLMETEADLRAVTRSLGQLKKLTLPWLHLLKAIHGELEDVASDSVGHDSAVGGQPISAERFTAWKERLPKPCGKIMDALLVQPLTQSQMITFCKMHYTTVSRSLSTLTKNGVICKDGNLFKLKQ